MILKRLQRWRHARGFGIHSPFAFHLITDVIYSKHAYYAFSDIEKILHEKQINISDFRLHHLTYRLIRYFNPASVLAIGSGGGVSTLYIASAMNDKIGYCLEINPEKRNRAEKLLQKHFDNIKFIYNIPSEKKYEGIVIDPKNSAVTPDELFTKSADNCFWIISGINSGKGKQFWRKTVILNKAVTFEMQSIGIVILNSKLNKRHYLI